ncbi:polyprenyl diphosphate synthase [Candidatus Purcelliella pentastirinorum]|uniref:polyprenyl diphosphate synthase n=1 Tax=Candidatus Purcelliella pentastirinorum TaxID=472834 RepID=UPI00237BC04D|nr:polyprenyl diphosphate synthase [Candidatus Purcelliella pentastirinorum]WDR80706.1 polyprenyl diphosphate synthase [Candidatus Purcelliella pentastirinorum]
MIKKNKNILNHVAIIMDGNGRWAQRRNKSRIYGHKKGVKAVLKAINFSLCNKLNVLTLYAFSSENWRRPIQEILSLIKLFICTLSSKIEFIYNNNICLKVIGNLNQLDLKFKNLILYSENLTKSNTGLQLNIAINYGGRWDIVKVIKRIVYLIQIGLLNPNEINENTVSSLISLNHLPPVDLLIRTGGEYRLSNFLLWQIAYTEFYFTNILWPDFDDKVFKIAIDAYFCRKRNFGGL